MSISYNDISQRFKIPYFSKVEEHTLSYFHNMLMPVAVDINKYCPDGREKSLALTKLEETFMWINKSIATHKDASQKLPFL